MGLYRRHRSIDDRSPAANVCMDVDKIELMIQLT